ncbi:MAG TPA: L,D-transpeptidase, partial [bacterium]
AFIEEGEEIPKDPRERYDPEMLGEYAMGFGDGYFIHGTIYKRLLGINVTHGCVRLGDADLKHVFDKVKIGTPVYIF